MWRGTSLSTILHSTLLLLLLFGLPALPALFLSRPADKKAEIEPDPKPPPRPAPKEREKPPPAPRVRGDSLRVGEAQETKQIGSAASQDVANEKRQNRPGTQSIAVEVVVLPPGGQLPIRIQTGKREKTPVKGPQPDDPAAARTARTAPAEDRQSVAPRKPDPRAPTDASPRAAAQPSANTPSRPAADAQSPLRRQAPPPLRPDEVARASAPPDRPQGAPLTRVADSAEAEATQAVRAEQDAPAPARPSAPPEAASAASTAAPAAPVPTITVVATVATASPPAGAETVTASTAAQAGTATSRAAPTAARASAATPPDPSGSRLSGEGGGGLNGGSFAAPVLMMRPTSGPDGSTGARQDGTTGHESSAGGDPDALASAARGPEGARMAPGAGGTPTPGQAGGAPQGPKRAAGQEEGRPPRSADATRLKPGGSRQAEDAPDADQEASGAVAASPVPGPIVDPKQPEPLGGTLLQIARLNRRLAEALRPPETENRPAEQRAREERIYKRMEDGARRGFPNAQYNLARMLVRGRGAPRDVEKAVQWLERSAERGYTPAELLLGYIHAGGLGGKPDLGKAEFWWTVAERRGNRVARKARELIHPQLASGDIISARRLRAQWQQVMSALAPPVNDANEMENLNESLRQAAQSGDSAALLSALLQGADADSRDPGGRSAVINAAWRGRKEILDIMLQNGADAEAVDNEGRTALMWGAINGHHSVVKTLVDAGGNPNRRDQEGLTPLMRAAWNGHKGVVEELLGNGADPSLRDRKGLSALDHARRLGHKGVISRLQRAK